MTKQTYEIIMACKYNQKGNTLPAVVDYMVKECENDPRDYTEAIMGHIMLEAMYDYIDTCDKPSVFLRELEGVFERKFLSLAECIARAFDSIRVRNQDGKYINGFDQWMNDKKSV